MSDQFKFERDLIELVGNASHAARNILAMKKRLEFPELQAIDTQVADIEGKAREIIIIFERDTNNALLRSKVILRAIFRNLGFLLRTLESFKNLDYEPLDDKNYTELYENLQNQKTIIESIDQSLNQQYCNLVITSNNNIVKNQTPKENHDNIKFDYFKFDTKPEYKKIEGNLATLTEFTKDICNRAHHMQSYVCSLQGVESTKPHANQIIGAAGQIENQNRAMLAAYDNQKHNIEQIKKVMINQTKAMGDQIKTLNAQLEHLNRLNQQEYSKYLYTILSWLVESIEVYDRAIKSPQHKIQFAY